MTFFNKNMNDSEAIRRLFSIYGSEEFSEEQKELASKEFDDNIRIFLKNTSELVSAGVLLE